jgi:hypothetical protein
MEKYLEVLAADVAAKSAEFATRIQLSMPSIICDVGQYSNEAFLLRSFVSLRADNNGDELAVTVDIKSPTKSGTISIESDVCRDDGTIIASGPAIQFPAVGPGSAKTASSWSESFDAFLDDSEPEVLEVLKNMLLSEKKVERKPGSF